MSFALTNTLFLRFVIVFSTFEILKVFSQDLPSIACPDKFQYRNSGEKYFGEITIYGALVPLIEVEAQFSQRERITTNYSGGLSLLGNETTIKANLQNGKTITYRVDFPNPQLLPKLIRLRVNNRTICSDYGLPAPSTIFKFNHTIYPTPKMPKQQTPPTRLINPFDNKLNNFHSIEPLITESAADSTMNFSTICGQEGSSMTSSSLGGNDFDRDRFPWLAAIYVFRLPYLRFKCSGTLISTRTIVATAACFNDADISAGRIVVYLGLHNLHFPESGVEERTVETLIKHPEFNMNATSDANIALLLLTTPVSFTQFIRPICLWAPQLEPSNQVAFEISWAWNNNGFGLAAVPRVFEFDVVNQAECLKSSNTSLNLGSSRILCVRARAGKTDLNTESCIRAGGSGLMISFAGKWILRAIFSSVVGQVADKNSACNSSENLAYCDLSKHLTWVHRNML